MYGAAMNDYPRVWKRLSRWANTRTVSCAGRSGVLWPGVSIGVWAMLLLVCAIQVQAQETVDVDVESARAELLNRWESDGLVKPGDVDAMANAILDRPLAEQTEKDLEALAKRANAAANFVDFILDEYQDYYSDNYRYDFVQEKVAPFHDAYVELSNRLKSYRNEAYFSLGLKAAQRGDEFEAFFYFRDAYRLSSFTEGAATQEGMRYKAEIEMKNLLGIEELGTFVYWQ